MGLRLTYHVEAQGHPRAMADTMAAILAVLLEQDLLLPARATVHVTPTDGDAWDHDLARLPARLREIARSQPQGVAVHGLRTRDTLPNLFHDYTVDERCMGGFLSICGTESSGGREARLTMSLTDVGFHSAEPALSAESLTRLLEEAWGNTLSFTCSLDEQVSS